MKSKSQSFAVFLLALTLTSCDPEVSVNYYITNQTGADLTVRIFGLRDGNFSIVQQYDTVILANQRINIHEFYSLGSNYQNPADTITIYDSIRIERGNTLAKSKFRRFDDWAYSEDLGKWGGGLFVYELTVRLTDF